MRCIAYTPPTYWKSYFDYVICCINRYVLRSNRIDINILSVMNSKYVRLHDSNVQCIQGMIKRTEKLDQKWPQFFFSIHEQMKKPCVVCQKSCKHVIKDGPLFSDIKGCTHIICVTCWANIVCSEVRACDSKYGISCYRHIKIRCPLCREDVSKWAFNELFSVLVNEPLYDEACLIGKYTFIDEYTCFCDC